MSLPKVTAPSSTRTGEVMLKRIGPATTVDHSKITSDNASVAIQSAGFPRPFPWGLEYNCPVHENWNIVHTGRLIPECHSIYVCSDNCLRGVIMTADEMNGQSHFSAVMPSEKDSINGRLEQVTIDGVSRVIDRLPYRPRAVQVFLVCMHHFVGADPKYIFRELEKRYPDIFFMQCWMDPIMQKVAKTPEQKQRYQMMLPVQPLEENPAHVNVLGDNLRLPDSSDIARLLARHHMRLQQVQDCKTYDEYVKMGDGWLTLVRSPLSVYGVERMAKASQRPYLYLSVPMTYGEITSRLVTLMTLVCQKEDETLSLEQATALAKEEVNAFAEEEKKLCDDAFERLKKTLKGRTVALDYLGCVRPLSTARLLMEHNIPVTRIYADAFDPMEEEDFLWLRAQERGPVIVSTNHPISRYISPIEQGNPDDVLAIGPKAAFFENTRHFVNQIESDGNWGFDAVKNLIKRMEEALLEEKDPEELVPLKGLGRENCVE